LTGVRDTLKFARSKGLNFSTHWCHNVDSWTFCLSASCFASRAWTYDTSMSLTR